MKKKKTMHLNMNIGSIFKYGSSSWLLLITILGVLWITKIDCRRQTNYDGTGNIGDRSAIINDFIEDDDVVTDEYDHFDCPEKFGYYPDVKNCSRYHICDHGKSTLKSCDDGLVFSTVLKTCDWPYNVHCNLANGDRGLTSIGDFVGHHLRLRADGLSDERNDYAVNNRRQPVLSNEADDSLWLGRPDNALLAIMNDDYDYNDHNRDPYNNDANYDIPRRKVDKNAAPLHVSNHVVDEEELPVVITNDHHYRSHRGGSSGGGGSSDGATTSANNGYNSGDNSGQPWYQHSSFDQSRRRTSNNVPRQPIHTTTTTTTTTTATTPAPTAATTFVPPISTNQRGNNGWRSRNRTVATGFEPALPDPLAPDTILPRKVFDNNGVDEYLLTDDPNSVPFNVGNELGDYRRRVVPLKKDDRDSYGISSPISSSITGRNNQLTNQSIVAAPVRSTSVNVTETRIAAPWTQTSPLPVGSRPRHLGSTVRRKVVRKKIVSANSLTTPVAAVTTTVPKFITTTTLATTVAPPVVPVSFRNQDYYWNYNQTHNTNTEPWKALRFDTNRNNATLRSNQVNYDSFNALRRTIPKIEHQQRFERKPVLKDPNETDDQPEIVRVHDEDDNRYFYNTPEITRNRSFNDSVRNHVNNENFDDLIPKNVVKDVSNNIGNVRYQSNRNQPSVPAVPRTDNKNLNKAFDIGFHRAVNPNSRTPGSFIGVPSAGADIEYEDTENDDEDENANSDSDGNSDEDNRSVNNNKEIVVSYDDEADDVHNQPIDHTRRLYPGSHLNTSTRYSTNLPQWPQRQPKTTTLGSSFGSASRQTPTPSPVGFGSYSHDSDNRFNHTAIFAPRFNSAIRVMDLTTINQPLHHHNASHDHLPSPIPFVTIVGPLQSNRSGNSFFSTTTTNNNHNNNNNVHHSNNINILPNIITPNRFGNNNPLSSWNAIPAVPPAKPTKPSTSKKINKNKAKQMMNKAFLEEQKFNKYYKNHSFVSHPRAKRCSPEYCQPPNCRCGGIDIPDGFKPKDIPQIVLLTFDDSVNDLNREIYRRLFEQGRTNPNGCPILSTFYVSHEWTDYSQVQNLYSKGHEIASHSVSHSFGEKFSKDRWYDEIVGQKEILHLYGGVDAHDIRGMRAPFLQTGGDTMFEMLYQANFSYDSSLPVYDIEPPYWPYTLDYSIAHDCMIEPCPSNSYPGFWEVGMVMWQDLRGGRCSMADGCFNPADADGVYEMVKQNFLRHYTTNRAPFGMYFHSRWFLTEHNMNGFLRFLDEMLMMDDIYLVTNWQMIQWMRYPTPLSQIKNFAPFGCEHIKQRPPPCKAPHTCKARFRGEVRTLKTCQTCPQSYPWTGNNGSN